MGTLFRLAWRMLIASTLISGVLASELPSRLYTTQDGLVRNEVARIRRDSRGYLWFSTWEGLSIFDGYQFTNYTVADGLPNRGVSDTLETRSGEYWIATYRGLCRFDPRAAPEHRFTPFDLTPGPLADRVNVLIERRDGAIWFGTEGGLWRLQQDGGKTWAERVPLPGPDGDAERIVAFWEDRENNLWVGASDGLYVIWRDGRVRRFADPQRYGVFDVLQDRQGRIWALIRRQLCLINPHAKAGEDFVERAYRIDPYPHALFESSDGTLWVASKGLYRFNPELPGTAAFQLVAPAFAGDFLGSPVEDAGHNLWVAGSGAMKVTRHGFTTYSTADGLKTLYLGAITEDRDGRLCVITSDTSIVTLNEFDGSRFTSVAPEPPGFDWGWGEAQISFKDHLGAWWIHGADGVLRFAPVGRITDLAHARPEATYTTQQGLPSNVVLRLFEDSRGDVWIGVFGGLAVWHRSTGRIQSFSVSDGLSYVTQHPAGMGTPLAIAEDRAGQIWIGFYPSGLARYRNGHFEDYSEANGLPKGQINGLHSDHAGRLWIASSQGGAARIDDVTAPRPAFRAYTIAQGLSSLQLFTIAEDRAGLIYLGGGRGVDRLDPDNGSVRHFTAADGLPPMRVMYSLRDHTGALWFGGPGGLARYVPEPDDEPSKPQPPLIRALRIAGRPAPVSVLGESSIADLKLPTSQNSLRIEFASLHFASGEVLRYEYRLEGADADWSPPTDQRTVNYSSLSPGSYRFVVRAVNGEGLASPQDATIGFVILPPVWRRAWFIGLMMCGLAAMLYAGHRYRVQQLLQVERIRTRLASDLHDDIGSGLAEIAILTDVAEVQPVAAGADLLRRAGDRARQLREAMSDIVWSVDPQHGNLIDLIVRVRQTVFTLIESNGTRVTFEAPADPGPVDFSPDRARHVLLITKEALTNVLRHADASEISVILRLEHRTLTLEVRDDGCGFDPAETHAGMGLRNLRRRAAESGGELRVDSSPRRGTRVIFRLPVR